MLPAEKEQFTSVNRKCMQKPSPRQHTDLKKCDDVLLRRVQQETTSSSQAVEPRFIQLTKPQMGQLV